jgi:hypothetical protein
MRRRPLSFGGGLLLRGLTANRGSNWLANRAIKIHTGPDAGPAPTCRGCRCALRALLSSQATGGAPQRIAAGCRVW